MEQIERLFSLVAAVSLTVYWGAVLVKLVRLARKIGKDPNAMPRERTGQLMRVIWYPVVVVMLTQTWISTLVSGENIRHWATADWLGSFTFPLPQYWMLLSGFMGIICIGGTVFTFVCWRRMGRSWRIGIDPKEKLELVSAGPYQWVRHPIYTTRMVIDVAAWVMVPTWLMALTVGVDILFMGIEACREEAYMLASNGEAYRAYMKRVGRFVPRLKNG